MPSILTRNLRARSRCWRQFPTTLSDASTRTNFPASPLSIKSSGRSERFAVKWNERAELKGVLKRNQLRSTCFLGPCHTFDYFLNGSQTTSCSRPEKGNEMREEGRVWVQWVSYARPKPKEKLFSLTSLFVKKAINFDFHIHRSLIFTGLFIDMTRRAREVFIAHADDLLFFFRPPSSHHDNKAVFSIFHPSPSDF